MTSGSADDTTVSDVIVCGYGPVGQVLTALLGRAGHRVTVLERHSEPYPLPRAGHFDHEVMRILQAIGVADRLEGIAARAMQYQFLSPAGDVLGSLPRDWDTPSAWPASYHFYQPHLEGELDGAVRGSGDVEVLRGREVVWVEQDGSGVTAATISPNGLHAEHRARYLVGADGANSIVRSDEPTFEVEDLGFRADWLVVDVELLTGGLRKPVPDTGQFLDPNRPGHVAYLAGPYYRWEFMVLPGDDRDALQSPEFIWRQLAPWLSRGQARIVRNAVYTFRSILATPWRDRRVLLAGDAAHLMPPFLGQGMCSGLRDANTLSWMLSLVLRGAAPEPLLDEYERTRSPHVRAFIAESVRVGRLVCITDPEEAAERDRRMLADVGASSTPFLPPIGDGALRRCDALAGTLAVQPRVRDQGHEYRLDDQTGRTFALLGLGVDPLAGATDEIVALADRFGIRSVRIDPFVDGQEPAAGLRDADGRFTAWLGKDELEVVLVRPDFYVFGSCRSLEVVPDLLRDLARRVDGHPAPDGRCPLQEVGGHAS